MKSKIDYEEILKIIDLLEERDLSVFELEIEGFKIKINRGQPPTVAPELPASPPPSPEKEATSAEDVPESQENQNDLHYITSPMVGTFYRAPDPSSPPFVEIGEPVEKNQTLCIIEAMKLMNEIESDIDGVLEEIYVQNGKPVEYGKKLFAIKQEK
jgi:acetyl-CoA carboxylase biotin carboxyl carrier protein